MAKDNKAKNPNDDLEPLERGDGKGGDPKGGAAGVDSTTDPNKSGPEPADKGGAKPDPLDRVRNEIAGGRRLVERLKHTGTGADKLGRADAWLAQRAKTLGATEIQPHKPDEAAQLAGAAALIDAMAAGQFWPDVTLAKAREIVDAKFQPAPTAPAA